jgi:hypothetical protein
VSGRTCAMAAREAPGAFGCKSDGRSDACRHVASM